MNNKELIADLSGKLKLTKEQTAALLNATVSNLGNELSKGNSVNMQGFGVFEARRKEERLSVNPRTKVRTLIPPKQVVVFKPSTILKNKIKESPRYE
jgi:DNA-binding protein HU-beta